nr:immunoglobulin heavy chain junction region [Mus musculus]MBK4184829.1 immunoglobulin heavy chain junction region [Mus musculus]
CVRATGGRDW